MYRTYGKATVLFFLNKYTLLNYLSYAKQYPFCPLNNPPKLY